MDAPYLAQRDTVISQAPPGSVGPALFFYEINRGPILPPVGSKYRDLTLRLFDRNSFNALWQGARSGVVKKLASVPYEIKGDPAKAQYYHDMLGYAHLGKGWEYLLKMTLTDYLTQSYGAIFEIAGPGDPNTPLVEPPTGINHLDALRCYVTGNREFPLLYYSFWDGKLHRLHASRVYMMVDDPLPDDRYMGIGTSALERAIAIAQREMRMGQYIDALLDDKPQPGIVAINNVAKPVWDAAVQSYQESQSNDALPVFGKSMVVSGTDPNAKVEVQVIPFSQTPEKFDFVKYTDLDVSATALALGVDRQEIWELAGRGLGSGGQSSTLHIKAQAKLYGDTLTGIERMMNWAILPDDLEFVFKENDPMRDQVQTAIDLQLAQAAQTLVSIGIKPEAIGRLLTSRSPSYQDSLTNDMGQVDLISSDKVTPQQVSQDVQLDSNTPLPSVGNPPQPPVAAPSTAKPAQITSGKPAFGNKAFSSTSADFRTRFTDILERAIEGRIRRGQAENLLLSLLVSAGTKAFTDGLVEGGVSDEVSDDDEAQIQDLTTYAIDYLDPLLTSAYDGQIGADQASMRAELWSNKTLTDYFNAGRVSADRNAMYMWQLGKTEDHCPDCKRLNGQVHRFSQWYSKGWLPQSDKLKCNGFNCDCSLKRTNSPASGRF